jgi:hypothetical protein
MLTKLLLIVLPLLWLTLTSLVLAACRAAAHADALAGQAGRPGELEQELRRVSEQRRTHLNTALNHPTMRVPGARGAGMPSG